VTPNVDRSWRRRLLATLMPASPDIAGRLAGHCTAEICWRTASPKVPHLWPGIRIREAGSPTRRGARESAANPGALEE
jgi:hypothetical protein